MRLFFKPVFCHLLQAPLRLFASTNAGLKLRLLQDIKGDVIVRRHLVRSVGGVALAYAEYLPSLPSTADILLVHGLASSGLQFEREAQRFAREGYRVLVPDLRGHGHSGVPDGRIQDTDFTIGTMAGDLITILDHAGVSAVHWVGNSLGGILALWLLGTPQAIRVRSLAVFGTCFSMNLPPQVGLLLRAAFLPGRATTAYLTALTTTSNPVGRDAIKTAVKQLNLGAGAAIASHIRRYDFIQNARLFQRPLLVLWGGLDRAVNLRLRGDIEKLQDHRYLRRVDLPSGGHCANFDMHDLFCTVLVEHWSRTDENKSSLARTT
jgi:3-oxoadipate enol-lactonase